MIMDRKITIKDYVKWLLAYLDWKKQIHHMDVLSEYKRFCRLNNEKEDIEVYTSFVTCLITHQCYIY